MVSTIPDPVPNPEPEAIPLDVDKLLVEHLNSLNAYVRARTGQKLAARESISDLVQSTCREALAAGDSPRFADESSFKAWLLTLAEHKILKRARHWGAQKRDRGREVRVSRMGAVEAAGLANAYQRLHTPSHAAKVAEEIERLEEALAQLPEAQREVLLLHRLLGFRHSEIAERTGRSEEATRQLLSKGLARLSRLLRPESLSQ
ncbi:MAG: sigma-70 family RNA polymerase sigma factor [Planctomycetota bacterium]